MKIHHPVPAAVALQSRRESQKNQDPPQLNSQIASSLAKKEKTALIRVQNRDAHVKRSLARNNR
jgi:hypothetical protein